ncbi:MAG TPA: HRDC domain-containing protein [Pyrinomonadaceae bacterium]|nr:HRDC domain-containing protein [Pyrinomonadaceae bacterium]
MFDPALTSKPSFRFITTNDEAQASLQGLHLETIIGLDTETYWNSATNKSHVSLAQIAPRTGDVLVFDLLKVEIELLRPLIESTAVTMTAHNARFDEGMLIGAGLRPEAFVDTLRLARAALRLPSYSLAGVVEHLFGIEMDKSYQKSNWKRRPLTRAQLEYAALDAYITLRVYDELERILREQGKFESALRSATLMPPSGETRAPRKRRAPQPPPRPLTDEERKAVVFLKRWRFAKSSDLNVPAYMICPDRTLEHLAMERPSTLESLDSIHGLGASKIARFGEELLETLTRAFDG